MKNTLLIIIGESGSGKTTLKNFISKNYAFKDVITYTTRPIRNGEKDGIDYHFIDKEKFLELKENNFFVETATYNNWNYGTSKESLKNGNNVIVLTPSGMRSVIKSFKDDKDIKIITVYLKVPRRNRLIKLLERGDNIEEAYRRNLSDVGQFDGIENEVDYVTENKYYMYTAATLAKDLMIKINIKKEYK